MHTTPPPDSPTHIFKFTAPPIRPKPRTRPRRPTHPSYTAPPTHFTHTPRPLSQPLPIPSFTPTPTTTHTHSGTLQLPHTLFDTLQLPRSPTLPVLSADDHTTDTRRFTVYTHYLPRATSPPLSPTLHTSPTVARTRYTRPPNTPTTPPQSDHDSDDSFPPYDDAEFQPLPANPLAVQIDPNLDGCNPSAANPLPYTNTDDYHADPLRYLQFQHDTVPPLSQGDLISRDDYPSDDSSDTYDTDVPLPEAPPTLDRHPVPPRDQVFNLPRGFLASHPTLHLAKRAHPQLLPSVPVCPGPYLPLYPSRLHRPLATAILHQFFPHQAITYKQITSHGLPNYLGAKITVGVNFPLQVWKDLLHDHSDPQVVMFMEFGWPTSYMGDQMPTLQLDNHASATGHPTAVAKYLDKEVRLGGLMGPFPSSPFQWTRLNPLMARPKKSSEDLRIILDLSFPEHLSINSQIPRALYEGAPYKLRLPTPLDFAELVSQHGQGSHMYKVDLARAYRQLPSDPFDWPLLGLSWKLATFIDLAIPFGLRHGAMACQRVTEAICFILRRRQRATTLPYIDDFGGSASKSKRQANNQYLMLKTVILELGLAISWDKCEPPTRFMTWVGTTFDSLLMVMSIERDKIEEALDLCIRYLASDQISLHDPESLLGKLLYSSKLANPARRFLNRTLQFRRSFASPRPKDIPQDVKEDLLWFRRFLPHYNGRAIIRSRLHPSQHLYSDASLVGGGAYIRGHQRAGAFHHPRHPPPLEPVPVWLHHPSVDR